MTQKTVGGFELNVTKPDINQLPVGHNHYEQFDIKNFNSCEINWVHGVEESTSTDRSTDYVACCNTN